MFKLFEMDDSSSCPFPGNKNGDSWVSSQTFKVLQDWFSFEKTADIFDRVY